MEDGGGDTIAVLAGLIARVHSDNEEIVNEAVDLPVLLELAHCNGVK